MQKTRDVLIDFVIGAYVLLPIFFRLWLASVYQCLIIAAVVLYFLSRKSIKIKFGMRGIWLFRALTVFVSMVAYCEIRAMIVYFVTPGLLFILLCNYLEDTRGVERLLNVLIAASVINALISAVEFVTGVNLSYLLCTDGTASYTVLTRYGMIRVAGAFANPINNGIFCFFIQMLCLYKIHLGADGKVRTCIWVIYTVNWIVLALTFSRAAILLALAANAILLHQMRILRPSKRVIIALCAALFCGLAIYLFSGTVRNKINEMVLPFLKLIDDLLGTNIVGTLAPGVQVEGVGNRMDLFDWVVSEMSHVWIGEGKAAKFRYVMNELGHTKRSIENQYLSELFHRGIIGLCGKAVLFLGTLGCSVIWAVRERKSGRIGLNAFLTVTYLTYFLMLFTVAQNEEKKVFYVLLALQVIYNTCVCKKLKKDTNNEKTPSGTVRVDAAIRE